MESKWLEDFLSVAETGSFSKSAQLRHVTQPAFSRRIQALEAWLGVDLIDRTAYPTKLTVAGETFRPQALEILGQLNATRTLLRGQTRSEGTVIDFALPHTLSLTFFPRWLTQVEKDFGAFSSRLIALNVHDAASRLADGNCDLLMAYHHSTQPLELDPQRYEMLELGEEGFAAYSVPKSGAKDRSAIEPNFAISSKGPAIPYLAYSPGAYFFRMANLIVSQTRPVLRLEKRYETDMAEGLKAMALQGHGIAFLPDSAVSQEVAKKRLVRAGKHVPVVMQIRLYRARSQTASNELALKRKVTHADRAKTQLIDSLWRHLKENLKEQSASK